MEGVTLLVGERFPRETDRAVQACNDYLRMGPGRTIIGLYRRYCKTPKNARATNSGATIQHWAKHHNWVNRASQYDALREAKKNARAERELHSGLALAHARVRKLKRVADLLEKQLYETDEQGALHNLWLPDVKQIGNGEFAQRIDIVRFNAAILSEFRAALDDLAREVGGRRQSNDNWLLNINVSNLTIEQLDRLSRGEDPRAVLTIQSAIPSQSRDRTSATDAEPSPDSSTSDLLRLPGTLPE